MARYRGTTAERGLGAPHISDKKRLMALHREGDPCWRCGQPMYKSQGLDRDHVIDRALGGAQGPAVLAHASCNRAAGARLGNRLRPFAIAAATGRDTICTACGKPYARAPRRCEICGAHYHPNHGGQRSCSRACGVALRRRIYGYAGSKAPKPKPAPKPRRVPEPYAPRAMVTYYTCRYCGTLRAAKVTGGQQREVCLARACQLLRLKANNWRVRYGMTQAEADAAVVTGRSVMEPRSHVCPGCRQQTTEFRWCSECLCTSVNAKGKQCGNVASADGMCEYHTSTPLASSRQW